MKLFLVTAAVATALAFPAVAEQGDPGLPNAQAEKPAIGKTQPTTRTQEPLNDTTGRGSGSEGTSGGGNGGGNAGGGSNSGSGSGGGGSGGDGGAGGGSGGGGSGSSGR